MVQGCSSIDRRRGTAHALVGRLLHAEYYRVRPWQGVQGCFTKPCVEQHAAKFAERVGVSLRGIREHGEAEARGHRRADAVLVGNELEHDDPSAWDERAVHLPQQAWSDSISRACRPERSVRVLPTIVHSTMR